MIEDHRKSLGITPRKISDEEIVQRLVFALVNDAAPCADVAGQQQHRLRLVGETSPRRLPHGLTLRRCWLAFDTRFLKKEGFALRVLPASCVDIVLEAPKQRR